MNDAQNSIMDMASYVCDHICQKPKEITDKEKLEEYCNGVCDLPTHICRAMNMAGIKGSIRCGDCKYRAREEETDTTWCRLPEGLGGNLEEKDECSRGRKVSESDT
jgi:hypothetical protein